MNTNKKGCDRLSSVATKIPTQGREALSRHKKLGSRHKDELNTKSLVAT